MNSIKIVHTLTSLQLQIRHVFLINKVDNLPQPGLQDLNLNNIHTGMMQKKLALCPHNINRLTVGLKCGIGPK